MTANPNSSRDTPQPRPATKPAPETAPVNGAGTTTSAAFGAERPKNPCAAEPKPVSGGGDPAVENSAGRSGRFVAEWIGASPNAKIPARVRLRVFERHNGKCHLTKRRIRAGEAWECDHVIALCNGGEHRESNLAPALGEPHKIKTKSDVREKSKVARLRKRHLGIKKDRTIRAWRKFDKTAVFAPRER